MNSLMHTIRTRFGLAALMLGIVSAQNLPARAQFLPVRAWGNNGYGQLGNGASSSTPVRSPQIITTPTNIAALSAGQQHSLLLATDGTIWAWGDNSKGQLGYTAASLNAYARQTDGLSNARSISAGGYTSYAVLGNDTVWAWGDSFFGELGNGTTDNNAHQTPVRVETDTNPPSSLTNVLAVSAGYNHCLALTWNGQVYAWGGNYYGQLGNNSNLDRSRAVPLSISNVIRVSAGWYHSLALKSDGTVWAWGDNDHGELGDGTYISRNQPIQVQGLSGVVEIAGAPGYSAAIKRDGTVWIWGYFPGTAELPGTTVPIQISGFANIRRIATGRTHILAIDSNDELYVYGSNISGQLGDPNIDSYQNPAKKLSGLYNVGSIAAGTDFSLITTYAAGLSGSVRLQGIDTNVSNQTVTLTFNSVGNPAFTRTTTVTSDPFIEIEDLPRRNYTIQIKGSKWLARRVNLDLTLSNNTDLDVTLSAGDASNDNAVDINDLLLLIAHYNKVAPNSGYLEAADFNCDGRNDISDLLLLIANYNKLGE